MRLGAGVRVRVRVRVRVLAEVGSGLGLGLRLAPRGPRLFPVFKVGGQRVRGSIITKSDKS